MMVGRTRSRGGTAEHPQQAGRQKALMHLVPSNEFPQQQDRPQRQKISHCKIPRGSKGTSTNPHTFTSSRTTQEMGCGFPRGHLLSLPSLQPTLGSFMDKHTSNLVSTWVWQRKWERHYFRQHWTILFSCIFSYRALWRELSFAAVSQEIHTAFGCSAVTPLEDKGRQYTVGKITAFAGLFTA